MAVVVLGVALPAVLSMTALVALNVIEARRFQERALLASARAVSASVDTELTGDIQLTHALATSEAISERDWARAKPRIARLDLGPDRWVSISDNTGARLLNTYGGPSNSPAPAPQGLPRPANILSALEAGAPRVSDLFWGARSSRHVIAVDAPAPDASGEVVVSLVSDPARFLRVMARQELPAEAMVTIVDRSHKVVARSRSHQRFVGASATAQMIAAMKASPSGVVPSRSLDGEPTVVAYAQSKVSGWTTLLVVPRRSIASPVWTNILAVVAVIVLAGGLGLIVVRRQAGAIAHELDALEQDARALGQGELIKPRGGTIDNFDRVQAALSGASIELERREGRQKLMINELNHRVKNTLATVQALAAQTFRYVERDARSKFDSRLTSLAHAHDLLTRTAWAPIDIRQIITGCAMHPDGRMTAEGPPVLLPAEAALALCMIIHELTTNSLKYGALSVSTGRVEVEWRTEGDRGLDLTWREVEGPPAVRPDRTGFGTRLMDRLAKQELNGTLERDYAPEGLVVRGRFTLADQGRWTDVA